MLHPNDDLFACGYAEPTSGTVCSVVGIDDLIVLGIIAAVTVAASQVSASEQESAGNDLLNQQQNNQLRMNYIQQQRQDGAEAAADFASRHRGAVRYRSKGEELDPWVQKLAIQTNTDMGKQANARQADATRTQGWIQAGAGLAGGIAGQALSPASTAAGSGGGVTSSPDFAERLGGYALKTGSSALLSNAAPVQTAPLQPTDPSGGFQLQAGDYQLLGGAQPYSQGPFGDDPYATAPQYQNPNRYRFGL